MDFNKLNAGYALRRHPGSAIVAGLTGLVVFGTVSTLALMVAETVSYTTSLQPAISALAGRAMQLLRYGIDGAAWQCVQEGLFIGAMSGALTGIRYWQTMQPTEPFRSDDPNDPRIFYDENAQISLKQRLLKKAGADKLNGLYIAPYLPLSQRLERRNILTAGTPSSGKSNLLRPIAQQAIARGDIVVLHCTKGEVESSFRRSDIILLSPTNKHGWAWDIGADIDGPAAAQEFAATVIAESKEVFFSNTARLVLADVITALGREKGRNWGRATCWRGFCTARSNWPR